MVVVKELTGPPSPLGARIEHDYSLSQVAVCEMHRKALFDAEFLETLNWNAFVDLLAADALEFLEVPSVVR